MTIYLFANDRYGMPFIEAARGWSRSTGEPVILVVSDRRKSGSSSPPFLAGLGRRSRELRSRRRFGVRAIHVDDVNSGLLTSRLKATDHGVVAGFNQIFAAATIGRFGSLVNFHPSLLPYYRGPTPSAWCLRNGEQATGFTLHRLTSRIDAGEVLDQAVVPIHERDDATRLDERIGAAAIPVFLSYLDSLVDATPWPARTVDAKAVYRHHPDYLGFHGS